VKFFNLQRTDSPHTESTESTVRNGQFAADSVDPV
jgi:hypothetical protein